MKKDSLTESVSRLHRAGSEHSQQTQKLRKAVDELITWMIVNLPHGFDLPCNCRVWRDGTFAQFGLTNPPLGTSVELWKVVRGAPHDLPSLSRFSELIAEGFLDQLSERLETQARTFQETTENMEKFVKRS